ncbi:MAG: tetratricopeptide repeat protein, partial [Sphingopyxis sp.]|nr:tetratricopeptide repeat protein [Sphingopyxis sp.]
VARGVTEALAGALGMVLQPPVVANLTHSKQAYDLYLQGRTLHARLFGDGVMTRAVELLEEAVAIDPDFAEAWVLLGDVHQRMGIYLAGCDPGEASIRMAACVRKAMAIKPGLGHAYGLLALHEFTRNNIVGALDLAFSGYEVEPANPAVSVRIGGLLLFCGLTQRGLEFLDEAIERDPVDGRSYMVRSAAQLNLGRIDEAVADAQRCVDLGFPSVWLGVTLAAAREHERAVEAYQQTRHMIANSIPPPSGMGPMRPLCSMPIGTWRPRVFAAVSPRTERPIAVRSISSTSRCTTRNIRPSPCPPCSWAMPTCCSKPSARGSRSRTLPA